MTIGENTNTIRMIVPMAITVSTTPPTSSSYRQSNGHFQTTLPSTPLSPLSLSGVLENQSSNSLGHPDAPGALGLSINDEPGSDEERRNKYWTIPLPTVTPTQESSSLLNYQEEQDRASVPQVMPGPHEESSAGGNPISHGSGPSAQETDWEVPQHLDLVTNLKVETPISIGKFLKLVQNCTHLAKLSVIINEDDSSQIINSTSVVAVNLIELSITTTVEPKPLLSAFTASQLKIFRLEWDTQNSHDPMPRSLDIGIQTFVENSGCYLNTLSLVNSFPDET
ncbi:hypothetical protein C0995_007311 [Termitomyces sp. Mi166|nr:hypothetical protein C0995_007311 [Termitomyces sp. Mi166\